MKSTGICRWLFLLLSLATWTTLTNSKEMRVVCYYTNWSVYRPGAAKFSPQNINPYLCTHLIYAFGGFTKENTLKPFDKYQDIEKGGYAKFTGLKTYNKNLKTMLAIGGWNEGSSRFSPMVANAERRKELVKNTIKFLRQNHFDGLDLDWEYPCFRDGGKPRDKDNYALLVKELREEFDRESEKTGRTRLLLTMAVPAGIEYINKGYDVPSLMEYLDWMNILSYDYHSAFEPAVNHHAPLYSLEEDSEYNYDGELNIDYTIKHYLKMGADPAKLILGIPTYGRSYTLYNPDAFEIGAPADGPGDMGEATRENGYLAYYEICDYVKNQGWEVEQPDPNAMGPYAYKENQWVGYDDEEIVRKKAEYVAENGLGGIMFWAIDNDDFRGNCHGKPYPLIEAAKEALMNAYGLTDANLISPPSKPTKPRTRSRPKAPSKAKPSDEEQPKVSKSSGSRRRNRIKSKAKDEERGHSSRQKNRRKDRKTTTTTTTTETTTHSSLKVTTPSYTTPAPPATPELDGAFKCEDEGFYPHPKDCKKYFWCLSGAGDSGIIAHQFTCPAGLYFNKAADSCDYTQNVLCNKKLPKPTTAAPTKTSSLATTTTPTTVTVSTSRAPPKITAATSKTTFRQTSTTEAYEEDEYEYDDEDESEEVDDKSASDSEEDPKVIKELIDLIKKAGGIDELEKQLSRGTTSAGPDSTTQSVITKSLYERVLSKAKNVKNTSPGVRNSRGPQNDGLSKKDEDKDTSTKDKINRGKLQYASISRKRPTTSKSVDDEAEDEDDEDIEEENAKSKRIYIKKSHPEYVTIRRPRVSSTTEPLEGDSGFSRNKILGEDEEDDEEYDDDNIEDDDDAVEEAPRRSYTPQYVTISRQRTSTTEETSTSKYKEIRRGSTTESTPEPEDESDETDTKFRTRRISTPSPSTPETIEENASSKYLSLRRGTTAPTTSTLSEDSVSSTSKYKNFRRGSTTEKRSNDTEDATSKYKKFSRGTTVPTSTTTETEDPDIARYKQLTRGTTAATTSLSETENPVTSRYTQFTRGTTVSTSASPDTEDSDASRNKTIRDSATELDEENYVTPSLQALSKSTSQPETDVFTTIAVSPLEASSGPSAATTTPTTPLPSPQDVDKITTNADINLIDESATVEPLLTTKKAASSVATETTKPTVDDVTVIEEKASTVSTTESSDNTTESSQRPRPKPFSAFGRGSSTSVKPIAEATTQTSKVSQSKFKYRSRPKSLELHKGIDNKQNVPSTENPVTKSNTSQFRTRGSSRFTLGSQNSTSDPAEDNEDETSDKLKPNKRLLTTERPVEERTYRPSELADLSSLTAVDFAKIKELNVGQSAIRRRVRPPPSPTTTVSTTTEELDESLKTGSRTLPLARKIIESSASSFGKSRRVIPKKVNIDRELDGSATTKRVRGFAARTTRQPSSTESVEEVNKNSDDSPSQIVNITPRSRRVVRRFRTTTPRSNKIEDTSAKKSPESLLARNRVLFGKENKNESSSSTVTEKQSSLQRLFSKKPVRLPFSLHQNNLEEENDDSLEDTSTEEGENIKLSESNIRENSDVNSFDTSGKHRRKLVKLIRQKAGSLHEKSNAEDKSKDSEKEISKFDKKEAIPEENGATESSSKEEITTKISETTETVEKEVTTKTNEEVDKVIKEGNTYTQASNATEQALSEQYTSATKVETSTATAVGEGKDSVPSETNATVKTSSTEPSTTVKTISSEPGVIVRTRKIIRKLKPTEATVTSTTEQTTGRRRKLIRRRPLSGSGKNETENVTKDEKPNEDQPKFHIRGKLTSSQIETSTKSADDKEEAPKRLFRPSLTRPKSKYIKSNGKENAAGEAEETKSSTRPSFRLFGKSDNKGKNATEEESASKRILRPKLSGQRSKFIKYRSPGNKNLTKDDGDQKRVVFKPFVRSTTTVKSTENSEDTTASLKREQVTEQARNETNAESATISETSDSTTEPAREDPLRKRLFRTKLNKLSEEKDTSQNFEHVTEAYPSTRFLEDPTNTEFAKAEALEGTTIGNTEPFETTTQYVKEDPLRKRLFGAKLNKLSEGSTEPNAEATTKMYPTTRILYKSINMTTITTDNLDDTTENQVDNEASTKPILEKQLDGDRSVENEDESTRVTERDEEEESTITTPESSSKVKKIVKSSTTVYNLFKPIIDENDFDNDDDEANDDDDDDDEEAATTRDPGGDRKRNYVSVFRSSTTSNLFNNFDSEFELETPPEFKNFAEENNDDGFGSDEYDHIHDKEYDHNHDDEHEDHLDEIDRLIGNTDTEFKSEVSESSSTPEDEIKHLESHAESSSVRNNFLKPKDRPAFIRPKIKLAPTTERQNLNRPKYKSFSRSSNKSLIKETIQIQSINDTDSDGNREEVLFNRYKYKTLEGTTSAPITSSKNTFADNEGIDVSSEDGVTSEGTTFFIEPTTPQVVHSKNTSSTTSSNQVIAEDNDSTTENSRTETTEYFNEEPTIPNTSTSLEADVTSYLNIADKENEILDVTTAKYEYFSTERKGLTTVADSAASQTENVNDLVPITSTASSLNNSVRKEEGSTTFNGITTTFRFNDTVTTAIPATEVETTSEAADTSTESETETVAESTTTTTPKPTTPYRRRSTLRPIESRPKFTPIRRKNNIFTQSTTEANNRGFSRFRTRYKSTTEKTTDSLSSKPSRGSLSKFLSRHSTTEKVKVVETEDKKEEEKSDQKLVYKETTTEKVIFEAEGTTDKGNESTSTEKVVLPEIEGTKDEKTEEESSDKFLHGETTTETVETETTKDEENEEKTHEVEDSSDKTITSTIANFADKFFDGYDTTIKTGLTDIEDTKDKEDKVKGDENLIQRHSTTEKSKSVVTEDANHKENGEKSLHDHSATERIKVLEIESTTVEENDERPKLVESQNTEDEESKKNDKTLFHNLNTTEKAASTETENRKNEYTEGNGEDVNEQKSITRNITDEDSADITSTTTTSTTALPIGKFIYAYSTTESDVKEKEDDSEDDKNTDGEAEDKTYDSAVEKDNKGKDDKKVDSRLPKRPTNGYNARPKVPSLRSRVSNRPVNSNTIRKPNTPARSNTPHYFGRSTTPRVVNKPSFGRTTESLNVKEELSGIDTVAVKNRNKNLFSKTRKINRPFGGTPESNAVEETTASFADNTVPVDEITSLPDIDEVSQKLITTAPQLTEAVTKPTITETTEYLTTLHHVFAVDEEEKSTNIETTTEALKSTSAATTTTSKIEKLIEVSRIVQVKTKEAKVKNHHIVEEQSTAEVAPIIDKIGLVNRVTSIKVVDGNTTNGRTVNEIDYGIKPVTTATVPTVASTATDVELPAKVQEIPAAEILGKINVTNITVTINNIPDLLQTHREDRKYDVYGPGKSSDKNQLETGEKAQIIDGMSHINVITPKPIFSTEASTIALEGLFQTDSPQSLYSTKYLTSNDEILETQNSKFVNVRVLHQDENTRLLKANMDNTRFIPISLLKQDEEEITMRAEVVEITPKANTESIKIVPIRVEMSKRIADNLPIFRVTPQG